MFRMNRTIKEMLGRGDRIHIAIVGCGKMGSSLIIQLANLELIQPSLIIDHTPEKAAKALEAAGYRDIIITADPNLAREKIAGGGKVVSDCESLAYSLEEIVAVVDASGNPITGADLAVNSIQGGKHLIMLNVECDSAVGPILYRMAEKAGVVYTGTKGDEPGAIIELVDFAKNTGLEVLLVGKGKNNQLDNYATDATVAEEAAAKGLSPHMLCSFVDGTNTMIELTAVCNACGFLPDIPGCHGITTDPASILEDLKPVDQGGIIRNKGVVEYAFGMAPGVFAIVTSNCEEVRDLMTYLKLGEGPNYLLYRPYHLTSMETPITIFDAVVNHESSLAPVEGQLTDVVIRAKRDLKKGESLKGIGRDTVFGTMISHELQRAESYVPIALINEKAILVKDIKKGDYIRESDLILDEDLTIVRLRRQQDRDEDMQ